jgi:hypothetical protein
MGLINVHPGKPQTALRCVNGSRVFRKTGTIHTTLRFAV